MKSTHPIRETALRIFEDKSNPLSVRYQALKVVCEKGAALNVSLAERCIQNFLAETFETKKEQKLREGALALSVKIIKQFERIKKERRIRKRAELAVRQYVG